MNTRTKMLTSTAMLCAIAYIAVAACRIPVVLFLKYDPKDVIITLGKLLQPVPECYAGVFREGRRFDELVVAGIKLDQHGV